MKWLKWHADRGNRSRFWNRGPLGLEQSIDGKWSASINVGQRDFTGASSSGHGSASEALEALSKMVRESNSYGRPMMLARLKEEVRWLNEIIELLENLPAVVPADEDLR